jgi:hypothetical protein
VRGVATTIIIALFLSIVLLFSIVNADFTLVLEHKENFKLYRNTLDSPVGLNGSDIGYSLHSEETLFVSWKVAENPLILPPIVWLLTEQQRNHFSHIIGGPSLLYGYILKKIGWIGNFTFTVQQNGTYFVVLHNGAWGALDLSGPILDVETYDATMTQETLSPYGPKADFIIIPESAHIGETVTFDAISSQAGWNGTSQMPITEYRWDFGDGNNTMIAMPIIHHVFSSSGTYYPTLTVFAKGATPETDSITHRIVITSVSVGGYSVSIKEYNRAISSSTYLTIVVMLTAFFVTAKRKRQQK